MNELMALTGKVAIVTGGAAGQGRVAAELFAQQGAKVVIADINAEAGADVANQIGGTFIATDMADEAQIAAMVAHAVETHGGIDILFNNAGVGFSASPRFKMAPITETPIEAWDAILDINLRGLAMACKHTIPHMVTRGGGSIINNASINAIAGVNGADAYTAAKGGIVSLTRVLALDWGAKGIRTNCICPGPVATAMINDLLDDPAFKTAMTTAIPMERVGTAEEIAAVAVFLATPAAGFINGAILPVDGGWSAK
ncbi:SDR family NAD(P)-dependent oxidoreductase [Psychromarinibacter sp. S121]|uniref:SDR family NAD(P)-dependent oxidoreductase n=1 Tax=Psychromarinibacter sp. S121 TaxID=3415127 RepID=UPI003C79E4B0